MKKICIILVLLTMLAQSFAFADVVFWQDEYYSFGESEIPVYIAAMITILVISAIAITIISLKVKSNKAKTLSIIAVVIVALILYNFAPFYFPAGNISHGRSIVDSIE